MIEEHVYQMEEKDRWYRKYIETDLMGSRGKKIEHDR